jgi:hypothetical protein
VIPLTAPFHGIASAKRDENIRKIRASDSLW